MDSEDSESLLDANENNEGKTVFKIFIWGGLSSDIWSEILFYSDASAEP